MATKKKTVKKSATKKTAAKKVVKKTTTKSDATKVPAAKRVEKASKPTSTKATAGKKEEAKVILRISVRAYENKILDVSVKQIIDTALRYDADVVGPVPLPTEIKKYTVNRSPFVFKDSREQFEIRVHKRMIDIISPTQKVIEALTNLNLPSGVNIEVKML